MCELRYRDAGVTYERHVYSERIEEGGRRPRLPARGASDQLRVPWGACLACSPPAP